MTGKQIESLRRMANQIAMNFVAMGHDRAVLATADHIDQFWDPRMKAAIFADDYNATLDEIAAAAIAHLAEGNHPEPQTRATEFAKMGDLHNSDAG
ncbi:MAG: formate dehydrogenase subunit delta [Alteraurantiacibacter sp.]